MKLLKFFICFSSLIGSAQFEAVFYEDVVRDTIYSFRQENHEDFNYDLVFPPYEYGEKHLHGGLLVKEIIRDKKGVGFLLPEELKKNHLLFWSVSLTNKGNDIRDSVNISILCKLATHNIERLLFVFFSENSNLWLYKEVEIAENGFLKPIRFNSKDLKNDNVPFAENSSINPTLLNNFGIIAMTKSNSASFTIYDVVIGNQKRDRLKVNHHFFKELLNQQESLLKKNVYELIDETNEIYDNVLITGTINLEPVDETKYDEKNLVYKILSLAFEYYPFYSEKKINRLSLERVFSKYWNDIKDLELCELLSEINQFLSQHFKDAHFGVELASECKNESGKRNKLRGPVRAVFIKDQLYVGAVLNKKFSKLKIGFEIKEIDGKDIGYLVDSLMRITKTAEHRKIKYIERDILSNYKTDSTQIIYKDNTHRLDSIFITYNQKSRIPKGFKLLKHCKFKKYNDSISYFSIKNWYLDTYLKFMNHSRDLMNSKRIVLDLRGNGGGEDLSSIRLFSTFLEKPKIYSKTIINGEEQPLVVKPNPYLKLNDKKVIILGDWLTACSSESFIMAMLQLPNVHFISSSKTYGSMAARYNLVLPSKNIIYINGLAGKNILMGEIEDKGIEPTFKPQLQKVQDLLPYDDKILSIALGPIEHHITRH